VTLTKNLDKHLNELIESVVNKAKTVTGKKGKPQVVISPYRFNPLGAHVDHQGGQVLARTLDQYTILVFWPDIESRTINVWSEPQWDVPNTTFSPGAINKDQFNSQESWIRYAQAAAAAFNALYPTTVGYTGYVTGTLVGAGLSSSASVVLAYLHAIAASNNITMADQEVIEIARQVENNYLGLNNGIQDQMSIVFSKAQAMSQLDMKSVTAKYITDPANIDEIRWVICYSGFDRELVGSDYNTRVAECREAAVLLDPAASVLGDLPVDLKQEDNLKTTLQSMPPALARRARHYFTEIKRVADGALAWQTGNWSLFGSFMNESCYSSINHYECGSQPLIDLHTIALNTEGVYGSRFGGGGYGGCLVMLTKASSVESVTSNVLTKYKALYPDRKSAQVFIAQAESGIRVESI